MMSLLRRLVPAIGILALLASDASANFGRFLRDPADSSIVFSYGQAAPTAFDRNVFCGDVKIGEIKFDYSTYLQKPNGLTSGGGALSGGFYQSAQLALKPGHSLIWVQTVISTRSGANDWGIDPATNGGEFPDATPGNPAYPNASTAATPPNPPGPPTLGFQDFPNRFFANGNQTWLAELGLVCVSDTVNSDGFREAYVIGSFLWGFGVTVAPNAITATPPAFWGAPTASYLATLNNYYDGSPPNPPTDGRASAKYLFNDGCEDCFRVVPEPTSIVLMGSGGFVFLLMRRRLRAA